MKKRAACIFSAVIIIVLSVVILVPAVDSKAAGIAAEENMNDDKLTNVSVPSGTTSIGARAYYGCDNLMSVIIPEGVTSIGESAFAMCPQLAYVQIPTTLKSVGAGAFAGDGALVRLNFSGSNNHFFYSDGVLYDTGTTEIIAYMPGNRNTKYVMPVSVNKIDKYAFWGAKYLNAVTVCNSMTTIEPFDFAYCTGLQYIYLPDSVKSIQEYAFRDCVDLKTVYAGNKGIKIADTAFYNASKDYRTVSGADASGYNTAVSELETLKKAAEQADTVSNDKAGTGGGTMTGNQNESTSDTAGTGTAAAAANTEAAQKAAELTRRLSGPYRENTDPSLLGYSYVMNGKALVIISDNSVKK